MDLYLSGILKLAFDLLHDLPCDYNHLLVVHDLRLYRNSYFAACLDSKRLVHAGEAVGDFLKLLESAYVVFKILAACAGTSCGDCVSSLYNS